MITAKQARDAIDSLDHKLNQDIINEIEGRIKAGIYLGYNTCINKRMNTAVKAYLNEMGYTVTEGKDNGETVYRISW